MYNFVLTIFALLALALGLSIYVLSIVCSNDKFENTNLNKICCGSSEWEFNKTNQECYKELKPLSCTPCRTGEKDLVMIKNKAYCSQECPLDKALVIINDKPYCSFGIQKKCKLMNKAAMDRCKKECKKK